MRLIIAFITLAFLSAQAMDTLEKVTVKLKDDKLTSISPEQHELLCRLSQAYADSPQGTSENHKKITLKDISHKSFSFIIDHLTELNELVDKVIEGHDVLAFHRLKQSYQKLSDTQACALRKAVISLGLPTRGHRGLPPEMHHAINKEIFKNRSQWPLVNQLLGKAIFHSAKELTGHSKPIDHIHLTSDNKLITTSAKTMKIWNLDNYQCTQTIDNKKGKYWLFTSSGNILVAANAMGGIALFEISTGKILHKFGFGEYIATPLILTPDNKLIVHAVFCALIKIYIIDKCTNRAECMYSLKGGDKTHFTKLKLISDNELLSGESPRHFAGPLVCKRWNLENGECISLEESQALLLYPHKKFKCHVDSNELRVSDSDNNQCIYTFSARFPEAYDSSPLLTSDNELIFIGKYEYDINQTYYGSSCNLKKVLRVFDLNTGETVLSYLIKEPSYNDRYGFNLKAVTPNNNLIATSHNVIKILDLNEMKNFENLLLLLSKNDVVILHIIQGEIVKNENSQLKDFKYDLCDKDGLNPLQKAEQLGASAALIQLLTQTQLFEQEMPSSNNDA